MNIVRPVQALTVQPSPAVTALTCHSLAARQCRHIGGKCRMAMGASANSPGHIPGSEEGSGQLLSREDGFSCEGNRAYHSSGVLQRVAILVHAVFVLVKQLTAHRRVEEVTVPLNPGVDPREPLLCVEHKLVRVTHKAEQLPPLPVPGVSLPRTSPPSVLHHLAPFPPSLLPTLLHRFLGKSHRPSSFHHSERLSGRAFLYRD
mmetsp:Transcript_14494/g.37291  ORF Transcript_14494/g.37291 Transcript_14494/m.37291 type:complete len:203 (-) Transcript_14494:796-1404(-)